MFDVFVHSVLILDISLAVPTRNYCYKYADAQMPTDSSFVKKMRDGNKKTPDKCDRFIALTHYSAIHPTTCR